MYRVSASPAPSTYPLSADPARVTSVLIDPAASAGGDGHRPRGRFSVDAYRDLGRWWDDLAPVAATGWGAVVVILPMLVVQAVIELVGAFTPASGRGRPR